MSMGISINSSLAAMLAAEIPVGAENAVSMKQLAILWRCSPREVRRVVAFVQREMEPSDWVLVSGNAGYYRSSDPTEIRRFVRRQHSAARELRRKTRQAERFLVRQEVARSGQQALDLDAHQRVAGKMAAGLSHCCEFRTDEKEKAE